MIFSINKVQILNIIQNEKFILIVTSLCCFSLLMSGSLATFYWDDVQRLTSPSFIEDYPLSNPNTVALFQVLCLYLILVLLIERNQTLSTNTILFCCTFCFLTFYILVLTLSRQACIVMVIIQSMFLLDAFIKNNNFSLKLLFFINFIISIIITIYVFISRGNFIEQQFEGRIAIISNYSMNFNINNNLIKDDSFLNKFEIFNVFIGKIFGMSTNSIVNINNFLSSKGLMYIPSGDSVFFSSINNGGIFLTSIIIYIFIQAILPYKFNLLSTCKMLGNLFIIIILSFGHVFNENFVAFIIFFLTLLIMKEITN